MKRYFNILAAALLAGACLFGCAVQSGAAPEVGETALVGSGASKNGQSQITGKITSVAGNEVTLALGEFSGSGAGAESGEGAGRGGERAQAATAKSGETGETGAAMRKTAAGQAGAVPEAPQEAGPSEESASSGTFTENGETTTLLIPVGLAVSGTGSSERSSGFSALKKGMVIRVALREENGGETVCAVAVLKK